jgi:folylpolyglutamate synthase/dihydropteroate synthase
MDPEILSKEFKKAGKDNELIKDPTKAYQALQNSSEEVLIVTGSFYLLSQIRNNRPT